MLQEEINIVWFKRDLRLQDHQPLQRAQMEGLPVLFLYCFEPTVMHYHDSDERHWRFVYESLVDMKNKLDRFGHMLYIVQRESLALFQELVKQYKIKTIFSHQEIGNKVTYDRDRLLAQFFESNKILWKESQTNAVIRKLKDRNQWEEKWKAVMSAPPYEVTLSAIKSVVLEEDFYQVVKGSPLPPSIVERNTNFQQGGESLGWRYLHSFLNERYVNYSRHISKPWLSRKGCSRLSPYISYGNLSIRQVFQETIKRYYEVPDKRPLDNFVSRLQWHCHFIQKFEDECRMEFENLNKAYDQIVKPRNEFYIQAWQQGKTGFPIIDASILCLIHTGYINFRMRAMVVSFFVYNLWQDWRELHFLARVFLDYEPGIHYPQLQMQSGTTGINTLRIYNPIKNSETHDPEGIFIKKWLPALKDVPTSLLHEPWKMTEMEQAMYNCRIGDQYPLPIVDLEETRKKASELMWQFRKTQDLMEENKRILKKHVRKTSSKETKFQKKALEDENEQKGISSQ